MKGSIDLATSPRGETTRDEIGAEDAHCRGATVHYGVSAPGTASLPGKEKDSSEWISGQVGGFDPGRQQRFDVAERLGSGQFGEHPTQVGVRLESVRLRTSEYSRALARAPATVSANSELRRPRQSGLRRPRQSGLRRPRQSGRMEFSTGLCRYRHNLV